LKRDGSIITTLKKDDASLVVAASEVNYTLISFLQDRDDSLTLNSCHPIPKTPTALPALSAADIAKLITKLSLHKSLSEFPFPDEFIHYLAQIEHVEIFNKLWDPIFLSSHHEIFLAKLIPLNKAHPNVPKVNQMRPIVATSCLFKLLELRFNEELNQLFLQLPSLASSQVGFLKGMTTHVNMTRLCNFFTED